MYLQNRTPHRVLDNKTLVEAFSGDKPEFSHLREFWMFSVHTHPKEKEDQARSFRKEGNIRRIQ